MVKYHESEGKTTSVTFEYCNEIRIKREWIKIQIRAVDAAEPSCRAVELINKNLKSKSTRKLQIYVSISDLNFRYRLKTTNGIQIGVRGELKQNTLAKSAQDPAAIIFVHGVFTFKGPDGNPYTPLHTLLMKKVSRLQFFGNDSF